MFLHEHPQDSILPALLQAGLIKPTDAERAKQLAATDKNGHSAVYHLVKLGLAKPRDVSRELARHFKIQGVDLTSIEIPPSTLQILPQGFMIEHKVIPVSQKNDKLFVAMVDPTNIETLDKIRFQVTERVIPLIADEYSIEQILEQCLATQTTQDFSEFLSELTSNEILEIDITQNENIAQIALQEEVESAPVVRFINRVLTEAVRRGASDVHFEFYENESRIRYRIDGALLPVASPPKKWERTIVSRLKIIGNLNIGERRLPQDGRTEFKVGNRVVDFRISTLPTTFGEKVVLRILDKSVVSLDLDSLGMDGREREIIEQAIQSPVGMILVTGPTGSGKTTTLYSILARLNRPEQNLLTIEDPVEYDLPGINQVAVKPDIGLDFSRALKAFLRQDPDVIMVGEIRDRETADIAVRAALTGHLVLSTIHTNDSASTITRLTEMGIERFNISTALVAIIAQRLVRRICNACKRPDTPGERIVRIAKLSPEEVARIPFMKGAGCSECDGTGYRGRIGIYEVLPITNHISDMIISGATATEIKQRAIQDGMQTLRAAGMVRVRAGITTLEEVIKHTSL